MHLRITKYYVGIEVKVYGGTDLHASIHNYPFLFFFFVSNFKHKKKYKSKRRCSTSMYLLYFISAAAT